MIYPEETKREGLYLIYVIVLALLGFSLKWFTMFEYILICVLSMIMIQLVNIKERMK